MEYQKLRLQPFNGGLYIDLSGLSEKYRDLEREQVKAYFISHRFIYSSTSLNMWAMFACQSSPELIWTEENRQQIGYYRAISPHLTTEMREEKAELEMKHVLVFGEIYPPSNEAMRQAHGAEDVYSVGQKEKNFAAVELGRLGGLAKSEAKAQSSRENGKKGGRLRKVREEEAIEESNLDLFTD